MTGRDVAIIAAGGLTAALLAAVVLAMAFLR